MKFEQQTEKDRAILAQVDELSEKQLAEFDDVRPKDLAHYLSIQQPWLEDEIYFLGVNIHHQPSETEIADCLLNQPHSLRFRAYYSLRFPERVVREAVVC